MADRLYGSTVPSTRRHILSTSIQKYYVVSKYKVGRQCILRYATRMFANYIYCDCNKEFRGTCVIGAP
jgi:hypothetical protein